MGEDFCRCPGCGVCAGSTAAGTTTAWLRAEIKKIEADERFKYPPATVFSNAPLALIQVELKSRHRVLTQVLKKLEG